MGKNSYLTFTDQFCGAGGSSTGAVLAGLEGKMALNHNPLAIETHNTNHPNMDHDCTDIQACDPRRYPSTDVLITSPECTNHSIAKGQKRKYQNQYKLFSKVELNPEQERSRATMWDVPRFAEYHDYNIVIVENVVDARRWRMWDAWLMAMHSLGYKHKSTYLNSRFFPPCPQSRDRMYVVFWKKGNPAPDLAHRPIAPCQKCGEKEAYQWWKNPQKKWGEVW
jgi:DNA (cytosine-5)-methyltransferase 1